MSDHPFADVSISNATRDDQEICLCSRSRMMNFKKLSQPTHLTYKLGGSIFMRNFAIANPEPGGSNFNLKLFLRFYIRTSV